MIGVMARKLRIESSEGLYHVINRGNYRSWIFETAGARTAFEATLGQSCERFGWQVLAYSILSNHFHLCLATPEGNLSEGMRWLQGTYAGRFNRLRGEVGRLFQGRFKSLIVEPGSHLTNLVDYIHLNPVRAGLEKAEGLGGYRWCSLYHFPKRKSRWKWLDASWLDYMEGLSDDRRGWRGYLDRLRLLVEMDAKEVEKLEKRMNRGWCIGSRGFKKDLARDYFHNHGAIHMEHAELRELNELRWEGYLEASLKALSKNEADLESARKSQRWKLAIAASMKRETSVTNQWLSEHLYMGAPNAISSACGKYEREVQNSRKYAKRLRNLRNEQ